MSESIRNKKHSSSYIEDYKSFGELLIISMSANHNKYEKLKEHHRNMVFL